MGFNTQNLSLRVWDLPDDDFARSELANNWTVIDGHDHSSGKGKRIGTSGLLDGSITLAKLADASVSTDKLIDDAVTSAKLADGAVGSQHLGAGSVITTKLADGAVTTPKIADSAVTEAKLLDGSVTTGKLASDAVTTAKILNTAVNEPKLATNAVSTRTIIDRNVTDIKLATPSVNTEHIYPGAITSDLLDPNLVPVGMVIPWYRPNDLTPIPTGWEVAIGQTLTAAFHDFVGGGSITLPDLRNRFILGAATTGTGSGTESPPAVAQGGGSNAAALAHSHTVNAHSHTVNGHTHGLQPDIHHHRWYDRPAGLGGNLVEANQRGSAVYGDLPSARRQAMYVPNLNFLEEYGENVQAKMEDYTHAHGGVTSASGPGTSSVSPGTSSQLGTHDNRPAFVGLLYLIKVKV